MGARSSSTNWSGYADQLFSDTTVQTVALPSEHDTASHTIRNPSAKDGFPMFVKDDEGKDIQSGWAAANFAFAKYASNPLFGYRAHVNAGGDDASRTPYKWDTFEQAREQVYSLANGMRSLKLSDKCNVGIFSSNREEWLISHLANWNNSYRTVALYATLGADAVEYIVHHAELELIFVEKRTLPQLFDAIRQCGDAGKDMKLRFIAQYDSQTKYANTHETLADEDVQTAKQMGLVLLGVTDLINNSSADELKDKVPTADDLAYIMYTSGTTGNPKGVMLSHRSFACVVASVSRAIEFQSSDSHVSYLPLAHIFESAVQLSLVYAGASIAFFNGNIKLIAQDWQAIRPTIMVGVPRIFSKTHDKIHLKLAAAGSVKKRLFERALAASTNAIRDGKRVAVYDKIMWSKVAKTIGFNRCRMIVSGAAPLAPHIAEFFKIVCQNAKVLQGYGLTETGAASFYTMPADNNLGHVGLPFDNVEARLIDAPECEYSVKDEPHPRGEIQIRGSVLMDGYFKNEEATSKVLDKETGWFSTGDIGRLNPNGTLSIIDRRKNMFKTAMGEYIAAEKCETAYAKAGCIGQIWIYGNSFKSFVVAVIVPDAMWLVNKLVQIGKWKNEDLTPASPEYCAKFMMIVGENLDAVKEIMRKDIREVEKTADLKKFEKIKDFVIEYNIDELLSGFNVANGTLTPTFKMKRQQLLKRYVEPIKKLYTDNGEAPRDSENWI